MRDAVFWLEPSETASEMRAVEGAKRRLGDEARVVGVGVEVAGDNDLEPVTICLAERTDLCQNLGGGHFAKVDVALLPEETPRKVQVALEMQGEAGDPLPFPDIEDGVGIAARRRLGREVFDRIVEPLLSGIYAGDAEKISLLATLPRFREMEKKLSEYADELLKVYWHPSGTDRKEG